MLLSVFVFIYLAPTIYIKYAFHRLNIRLLYFIRDPRGTMQSRHHRDWCPGVPDCDSPAVLCSDLEDDYYAAQQLRKEYPGRFL